MITAVESRLCPSLPGVLHVLLHDADGVVGLGETIGHPEAVAALVASLAPRIAGVPLTATAVATAIRPHLYDDRRSGGDASIESRAASALDMAAWDGHARRLGIPLAEALGGRWRDAAPVYTTCLDADHDRTLSDPAGLAADVAADGFGLVKVWPFAAGRDLAADVALVQAMLGHGVDVAVDLACMLAPAEAIRAAHLLDTLGLAWIEDPLPPGPALAALARTLRTPVVAGESLAGAPAIDALLDGGGVGLLHVDAGWCGGPTGVREAAALAAAHGIGVTLHDCSGPVTWATSLHLALHLDNVPVVECARTLLRDVYPRVASGAPSRSGSLAAPGGPGHGVTLKPGA